MRGSAFQIKSVVVEYQNISMKVLDDSAWGQDAAPDALPKLRRTRQTIVPLAGIVAISESLRFVSCRLPVAHRALGRQVGIAFSSRTKLLKLM